MKKLTQDEDLEKARASPKSKNPMNLAFYFEGESENPPEMTNQFKCGDYSYHSNSESAWKTGVGRWLFTVVALYFLDSLAFTSRSCKFNIDTKIVVRKRVCFEMEGICRCSWLWKWNWFVSLWRLSNNDGYVALVSWEDFTGTYIQTYLECWDLFPTTNHEDKSQT